MTGDMHKAKSRVRTLIANGLHILFVLFQENISESVLGSVQLRAIQLQGWLSKSVNPAFPGPASSCAIRAQCGGASNLGICQAVDGPRDNAGGRGYHHVIQGTSIGCSPLHTTHDVDGVLMDSIDDLC
jgi:hypothetical protein